jgi:serine/threonine protein kinase
MMAKKVTKKETAAIPDESVNARKLLAKAAKILRDVDQAVIFKTHPVREVPSFERSELKFGPVLGVGGFSIVKEIRKVTLRAQTAGKDAPTSAATEQHSDALVDDEHYDISTAREQIASRCLRDGDARYAVKFLHPELSQSENARGIVDLALEAKYLSVISHPNIIKMRGLADTDPLKNGFFVLLDRLYDTLDLRIKKWQTVKKQAKGSLFGIGSNKEELNILMRDRLLVAYDLASAFRYLHENKLVYRDIKPENIGFDVRGDVKLFDFGLMANLRPNLKCDDGMYKLSGLTGSFPYMAPVSFFGLFCVFQSLSC